MTRKTIMASEETHQKLGEFSKRRLKRINYGAALELLVDEEEARERRRNKQVSKGNGG